MTWISSLQRSQLVEKPTPLTLFSGKTSATTAPAETNDGPPYAWTGSTAVGDNATDVNGNGANPPIGSIRCDGWRQVSVTVELYVSSGSGTATYRPYWYDGTRWVKGGDVITFTSTATATGPAARERHDISVENDYGFCLTLESISGTGATAAAYAIPKDALLGRH